jgi:hypothetical protein
MHEFGKGGGLTRKLHEKYRTEQYVIGCLRVAVDMGPEELAPDVYNQAPSSGAGSIFKQLVHT